MYNMLPIQTCLKLRIADYYVLQFIYLGMQIEDELMKRGN